MRPLILFFTVFLFIELLCLGSMALMMPLHGLAATLLVLAVHYFAIRAALWASQAA